MKKVFLIAALAVIWIALAAHSVAFSQYNEWDYISIGGSGNAYLGYPYCGWLLVS